MNVLLVNPHIYDFAAYGFWSSPLGLLYLGGILRKNGMNLRLIDCMVTLDVKRKPDGRAPFLKKNDPRPLPAPLAGIRKRLKRYGMSDARLREALLSADPPDLVLITSIMTYWYPGTREAASLIREAFPAAKIVVGGIYPSLCADHAFANLRDAHLVLNHTQVDRLYAYIEESLSFPLSFKPSPYDLDTLPYPAFDLYESIPFVPLLTSYGCSFACAYCATPYMHPAIVRRNPAHVVSEIRHWQALGVKNFAIYDDNFLHRAEIYAKPMLTQIASLADPMDIYNPNAVNAALITEELAELLKASGFREVRLGLETVNPELQHATGAKVNSRVFERAVAALFKAGFPPGSIAAYIMAGLPLQPWEDVQRAIDYLADLGVRTHIAEYTPIPHTPLFDRYHHLARYPITDDPLYQNNALFPFAWEGFTEEDLERLKRSARDKNALLVDK
ncbi:MAG: radical SAM protein [Syntrophobacterales bacterium]|jgi:radical SAM superfamily enzyme YgiQ (UPF0313 family)|nr:radical SAM protein [Syntrophobacterales bacterium]